MATTLSRDELLDAIGNMTVLELSEFVKAFEEKFGVTAAAPMAVPPRAGGGAAAPAVEEQTEFDVVLPAPARRRSRSSRSSARSPASASRRRRTWSTARPKTVKEGVSKEEAEQIKAKLEEQGASVELK
jgi:large subunit ribosomal protein L7/L12